MLKRNQLHQWKFILVQQIKVINLVDNLLSDVQNYYNN